MLITIVAEPHGLGLIPTPPESRHGAASLPRPVTAGLASAHEAHRGVSPV